MKNKTNIIHKINSFKNNVIEGKKESSKPKKSLKNIETKISPESIQKINLLSNDSKKTPNLCVSAHRIKINQHMKITAKNKNISPPPNLKTNIQKNYSNDALSLSEQFFSKTKPQCEKRGNTGKNIKMNRTKRYNSSNNLLIKRNKSIDNIAQIFIKNNNETKKNKTIKKDLANKIINMNHNYKNSIIQSNNPIIERNNQIEHDKKNLKFHSNIVNYNNFQNLGNNNFNNKGKDLNSLIIGDFNKTYNNVTNSDLSNRRTKNTSVRTKAKITQNEIFNPIIYNYNLLSKNKSSSKDKYDQKRKQLNDDIQNILIMNKENKYQMKPKLSKIRKNENEKVENNRLRNNRLTEANKKKSESNLLAYYNINNKNNQNNSINTKKNIFYQYLILKGNASYLVKNCMQHRINWIEGNVPEPENSPFFNFKWKELSAGIDYIHLNKNPKMKQMVNHFEFHHVISNKANLFINLMKYCEKNNLSVFKFVPFTIVFKIKDRRKIKNKAKQKRWMDKLEKLKNFIQRIDTKVTNFNSMGKYYTNEEYIQDKKDRDEFELMKLKKRLKKEEEKKPEEEKYKGKYEVYSDIFPRLKKVDNSLKNKEQNDLNDKDKEKKVGSIIGSNTLIEIPDTHFKGRNMWVLKAVNLNRGMCIKVVNSFQQMEKVINKFKSGVDYSNFTLEKIDEQENEDNLNLDKLNEEEKNQNKNGDNGKNNKDKEKVLAEDKEEKLYNCNKILIQKYIESPLLYRGRKCDMRIWVLLTHEMKVYFFKEGHLKTCSVEYNVNSEDAFTHITNYSFQKYNSNFQKFEKGNEVPFYEFQKFIDEAYPEKNYKLKNNLVKQIKEIIKVTMLCGKNKINKNKRNFQFEIFGYDFMMDSDFNVFLIEINYNPGLEISSPWIQIVIPRMLDDALRLTLDKVFEPVYDFNKNYVGEYTIQQKKLLTNSEIKIDFNAVDSKNISSNTNSNNKSNANINTNTNKTKDSSSQKSISISKTPNPFDKILNINLELDDFDKQLLKDSTIENEKNIDNSNNNEIYIEENKIEDVDKIDKQSNSNNNKTKKNNKKKKKKYVSPFPVPGYSLDDNLWEFVCDLNDKNKEENKTNIKEKEINKDIKDNKDKNNFTGIKHLLKKKKSKPNSNVEKNKEF